MSVPVTVSITRRVDPAHEDQMLAWLSAGTQLAQRFDGFLGSGWVRSGDAADEWHSLYRFADEASLVAWEGSDQRRWWLEAARDFVGDDRMVRRTGIEGWFDEPFDEDLADLRGTVAPPRWKQAVAIFVVFFPLSVAGNYLVTHLIGDWWLPLRVLVTVCVMTPLMVYVGLPWITGLLAPWLHRPARRRRA